MDWYAILEERIRLSHIKTYLEIVHGLKLPNLKSTGEHYAALDDKQRRAILKSVNAWCKYMGFPEFKRKYHG